MEKDLELRTKKFSVQLIRHLSGLPRSLANDVISRQLLRSGTSVGANYREANRAVSRADFANKIGIVQKEASEPSGTRQPAKQPEGQHRGCSQTQYWIELLQESGIDTSPAIVDLHREASELLAIFTTIGRKLKE